jgi:hypothetical protein
MENELTVMWGKFLLNEDENAGVSLAVSEIEPMVHRGKVCFSWVVVGRT